MSTMLVGLGAMVCIFLGCAILGVHLGDMWEVLKIWLGFPLFKIGLVLAVLFVVFAEVDTKLGSKGRR
jgi:hypothetical protein